MKNKALHFMAAAVLSSALLMTGCGSHSGDTNSSTKQTQDQTQRGAGQDSAQTSAAEDQNQASDDQNQSQDTQTPETHPDLETRVETAAGTLCGRHAGGRFLFHRRFPRGI